MEVSLLWHWLLQLSLTTFFIQILEGRQILNITVVPDFLFFLMTAFIDLWDIQRWGCFCNRFELPVNQILMLDATDSEKPFQDSSAYFRLITLGKCVLRDQVLYWIKKCFN